MRNIRNLQWVYYDETGCADPWGTTSNASEAEKVSAIEDYFKEKEHCLQLI